MVNTGALLAQGAHEKGYRNFAAYLRSDDEGKLLAWALAAW
jgi:hypothetical protein